MVMDFTQGLMHPILPSGKPTAAKSVLSPHLRIPSCPAAISSDEP